MSRSSEARRARQDRRRYNRDHPAKATARRSGNFVRRHPKFSVTVVAVAVLGCCTPEGRETLSTFYDQRNEGGDQGEPGSEAPHTTDGEVPVPEAPPEPDSGESLPEPSSRAAGDIADFLGYLTGNVGYPDYVNTIAIEAGPDEVGQTLAQIQENNRASAPEVDPGMVDAVTSCAAADLWEEYGDWPQAVNALAAGDYALANTICIEIVEASAEQRLVQHMPDFASTS